MLHKQLKKDRQIDMQMDGRTDGRTDIVCRQAGHQHKVNYEYIIMPIP